MSLQKLLNSFISSGEIGALICSSIAAAPILPPNVWSPLVSPQGIFDQNLDVPTQGMSLDPSNPSTIYLCIFGDRTPWAVSQSGLWKTTDGGSHWGKVGMLNGKLLDHPTRVRVDSRNPNHVYAGCGVANYSGFLASHDAGATFAKPKGWADIQPSVGTIDDVYDIAVDPADFNHVLVVSHSAWRSGSSGIMESKDGGDSWVAHNPQSSWGTGHSVWFLDNSNTWLLGTQGDGLWRTNNAGGSWSKVSSNGISHGGGQLYRTKSNVLFVSANSGVMRSTDNGVTWTQTGFHDPCTGVGGDGNYIYTKRAYDQTGPFSRTPESDGMTWSSYSQGGSNFKSGPFEMAFDSVHGILYSANWWDGLLGLKSNASKPALFLSDTLISASYDLNKSWSPKSIPVTAVNAYRSYGFHLAGQVTASHRSAWLSLSMDAANPDSQVITNVIDPSSLPNTEAKYYDTVMVHAKGAEIEDFQYKVVVWVRQSAVLTSVVLAPPAATIFSTQSKQFTAIADDQYGLALAQQPAITWNATGGTVNGNGFFTSGECPGLYTITATALGVSGSADVTVVLINLSQTATATASSTIGGYSVQAIKDGKYGGYPANTGQEWASNGETVGAWAQLTWPSPVTIDSVALWDRPYTGDQILSGALSFSDGSTVSVGALPNDASAPWSGKFAARTATWVKFTAETVSATSLNVGLTEFEVFNTGACTTIRRSEQASGVQISGKMLSAAGRGFMVIVPGQSSWRLELFSLSGAKVAGYAGKGSALVPCGKFIKRNGFLVVKLTSGITQEIKTIAR